MKLRCSRKACAPKAELGEVVHEVGDGVLLEDHVVIARVQVLRLGGAQAPPDRFFGDRFAVDLAYVEGQALRVAAGRIARHDRVDVGGRVAVVSPDAEAVRDGDLALRRPEGARRHEAAAYRCIADRGDGSGAFFRAAVGRALAKGADGRNARRARQRDEVLVVLL